MVQVPGEPRAEPEEMSRDHHDEESEEARIERLGRQRPACFDTWFSEYTFCFSVVMSQILAEFNLSGFSVLVPILIKELDIPQASSIWPSSALSLAVTTTLLIFGRLADMYGAFALYMAGMVWLTVSSIVAGFSPTWLMLVIFRALQGVALAAFLPSGVMVLGSTYRPGPRKNVVFGIYGACAVLGFYVGILIAGLCGEFLGWRWFFYIGGILSAVTTVSSYFSIPVDFAEKRKLGKEMDWWGGICLVLGLVLFAFAIADSSHARHQWTEPYILVCFLLGTIFLCLAVYVEGWVAKDPLLPAVLFAVPSMTPLIIALLCMYGSAGIFLLYGALYMQEIMGATPLQMVAWTTPLAVGGILIATVGGFILHKISGTILMIISSVGFLGSSLFFALIPIGGNYWAFVFPAMICTTVGLDIAFNITNVFITTNVSSEHQGIAGALINCTLHFGITLMLGFSDIIQTKTISHGVANSYKAAFWFQFAISALALAIMVVFVKIDRAKSDLTVDERRQRALES